MHYLNYLALLASFLFGGFALGDHCTDFYEQGKKVGYKIGYKKGNTYGYDKGIRYKGGYDGGYSQGKKDGYGGGYSKGKKDGYENGHTTGLETGYNNGYSKAQDEYNGGVCASISIFNGNIKRSKKQCYVAKDCLDGKRNTLDLCLVRESSEEPY